MTIHKYEVAENAYISTAGKFHVRGISGDGRTQFENQSVTGFATREEAQEYCDYANLKLAAY